MQNDAQEGDARYLAPVTLNCISISQSEYGMAAAAHDIPTVSKKVHFQNFGTKHLLTPLPLPYPPFLAR